ncbi:ferric reductase-like transmembrane domain-containing protein [Jannaschia seohaensis]|uniref:MYXO-CTERM domain-containing protein n=1 Tax=Jannaschia seohaensis TaxID=475081 RepID=A0A2Y9A2B6_9RHOB|nr:ferric reductase-like transmembrane domain-containing protein [Jannaschia seohaensis]PWJ22276.1 MYXO-CTERM domain-containing protein [Jannaschia seohaensis]SSA38554.1 MYXO-CTERM domain-containing protein [Jannaschia seohaensis]
MGLALGVPLAASSSSPLLAWREPVYIVAGFAGVVALGLLLVQPLLVGGHLPGPRGRVAHRWVGAGLVAAIVVHVAGLWITSPPDVIDALTFTSPTPFSGWGVVAMWAAFGAAGLAAIRRRMRPRLWRPAHSALVAVVVIGTVVHALLIQGTMGTVSKAVLCACVLAAAGAVMSRLRAWAPLLRR